jgi:hypothetical protein
VITFVSLFINIAMDNSPYYLLRQQTAFSAASARLSAVVIVNLDSLRSLLPTSTFVPSSLTIKGTLIANSLAASMIPSAMVAQCHDTTKY